MSRAVSCWAASSLLFAAPAAASCAYAGTWAGRQTDLGGGGRPITITVRPDCTYTWVSSRITTEGAIRVSQQGLSYSNAAGSVGSVTGNNRALTFRHFRGDYSVSITRR